MLKYIYFAIAGVLIAAVVIFLTLKVAFFKYKEVMINTSFSIQVEKIKKYKGYLYLNDSIQIPPVSTTIETKSVDLYDFIQIGDKLDKINDDNLISLTREQKLYYFRPVVF